MKIPKCIVKLQWYEYQGFDNYPIAPIDERSNARCVQEIKFAARRRFFGLVERSWMMTIRRYLIKHGLVAP